MKRYVIRVNGENGEQWAEMIANNGNVIWGSLETARSFTRDEILSILDGPPNFEFDELHVTIASPMAAWHGEPLYTIYCHVDTPAGRIEGYVSQSGDKLMKLFDNAGKFAMGQFDLVMKGIHEPTSRVVTCHLESVA